MSTCDRCHSVDELACDLMIRLAELEAEKNRYAKALKQANKRVDQLEAERKLCVTTKYHDSIVEEAMTRAAKLEAEGKRLEDLIKEMEWGTENLCNICGGVFDNHESDCKVKATKEGEQG